MSCASLVLLLRLLHLLCVCVVLLLRGCCLDLLYEAVNARQQPTRRRKCFCLGFIFLQSKFRPTRNNNNNEKENNSAFFESGTKPREILSFKPLAFFVFGWAISVIPYFILEHEVDHQGLPLPAQIPKRTAQKNQTGEKKKSKKGKKIRENLCWQQ